MPLANTCQQLRARSRACKCKTSARFAHTAANSRDYAWFARFYSSKRGQHWQKASTRGGTGCKSANWSHSGRIVWRRRYATITATANAKSTACCAARAGASFSRRRARQRMFMRLFQTLATLQLHQILANNNVKAELENGEEQKQVAEQEPSPSSTASEEMQPPIEDPAATQKNVEQKAQTKNERKVRFFFMSIFFFAITKLCTFAFALTRPNARSNALRNAQQTPLVLTHTLAVCNRCEARILAFSSPRAKRRAASARVRTGVHLLVFFFCLLHWLAAARAFDCHATSARRHFSLTNTPLASL